MEMSLCRESRTCRGSLARARSEFGDKTCYGSFAVVSGAEDPSRAKQRNLRMKAQGVKVGPVCYTPHDWHEPKPYVNVGAGWIPTEIESFT
jgi:hypothetical protein